MCEAGAPREPPAMTRPLRFAALLSFLFAAALSPLSAQALAAPQLAARSDEEHDPTPEPAVEGPTARPRHIGPYRVLRELGAGGMGRVYLAESLGRVQRRVALKVLNEGIFSPRMLAQFEIEAQALASVEHEHVARLYEVGADDDGRPWMAMEWVDGEPLNEYCDRRALALDQRLELFAQVARAVEHMHGRGVLHGDLKPANILVCERDGRAMVKVIDLGLARVKFASADATDLVMGTPAYMAPEHFGVELSTLDARADVFALGVVLRELLVGGAGHALDSIRLAAAPWLAAFAPRTSPSEHLRQSGAEGGALARLRRSSVRRLQARLEAGLDGVVQRASALRREDRTASAAQLAREVEGELDRHARARVLQRGVLALSAAAGAGAALGAGLVALI